MTASSPSRPRPTLVGTPVLRDRDFRRFWGSETVSLFGSEVATLALPLTAAVALHATPGQLGLFAAARFAPFLLFTLPVGAWADRRPKRPILVAANLGRGALTAAIPVLALAGVLSMPHLYVLGFLIGILTVLFDVAYLAYVPSLVGRDRLVAANSRLATSASAAEITGPGLGGVLVEALGAPLALFADAASFLLSAVGVASIRRTEPRPEPPPTRDLRREIGEGLRVTFGNRCLRAVAGEAGTYNLFEQVFWNAFLLAATREMGIGPGLLGVFVASASVGGLAGSLVAGRAAERLGIGRALVWAMVLACSALLLVPLVRERTALGLVVLAVAFATNGFGVAVSNVHAVSLRQAATPSGLLARMNASYRMVIWGTIPLGALLGGLIGDALGLRTALAVGALGLFASPAWVLLSPLPHLRRLPDADAEISVEAPALEAG